MNCMVIDNNSVDAVRVRSKWNAFYSVWRQSITTEDVNTILEKYLATHEESPYEKKIGDKYGRFVHGWDDERQEPIIVYSPTYAGKEMKHNLDGIPLDYYRSEIDELSIEEEREAIIEFYKEHGVDMGAYEVDEDELPF